MVRVVQLRHGNERRVALVAEPYLHCLQGVTTLAEVADEAISAGGSLTSRCEQMATSEKLSYDDVYHGRNPWKLLSPIDLPQAQERVFVSGTGLTHLWSAQSRAAMPLLLRGKRST